MRDCEEYQRLEHEVDLQLKAAGKHDAQFSALWCDRMYKIPAVNASVAKLLNQHKREFANAGFSLDDIFLRDDIDWCVNQLACAFAKKIAMGERYAADGVRGHKNQGYQMGSTLVEIANQRAQARLSRAVMADEDARLIPLGNERGLKLLGLVIPYVLRAVTSEMEPREEDLIEPWITVIEPQPIRMQPQDGACNARRNQHPAKGMDAVVRATGIRRTRPWVEGNEVHFAANAFKQPHHFFRIGLGIIHAGEHHILEHDVAVIHDALIFAAGLEQILDGVFAVDGNDLVAQIIGDGMQRNGQVGACIPRQGHDFRHDTRGADGDLAAA
jgi:hypothetical protein